MSMSSAFDQRTTENRGRVVRMALVYTPMALLSLAAVILAVVQIVSGNSGFFFMLIFFGIILFLTGFQALEYLKDLSAAPIEYEGELVKKWHKGNLFIFFLPSYYLAMDTRVLSGRVNRIEPGGVFVTMDGGAAGFVARKDLVLEKGQSPEDIMNLGDEIKFKVTGVDGKGTYKLNCRKAEERDVVTKLFSVSRVEYGMLLEQDMIKVTCYPNSLTVECIDRYDDHEKKFVPATSGSTL
jgi:predicted RNA-binding protein with RPS1 domain